MKHFYVGAGHGASDPGAVGNGLREADVAVSVRDAVAKVIEARLGVEAKIVVDGGPGRNLPLVEAIKLAKVVAGPRIELHCNAGPVTATGVECLSMPEHKALAQKLAQAIGTALGLVLRGDKGWKSDSSGQHHRLGFCREGGGVIVEMFFISSPKDVAKYHERRQLLADAIAKALMES